MDMKAFFVSALGKIILLYVGLVGSGSLSDESIEISTNHICTKAPLCDGSAAGAI